MALLAAAGVSPTLAGNGRGRNQPGLDALTDHRALELGEHAHHLEQRLACGCRGVHALLMEEQVNPKRV